MIFFEADFALLIAVQDTTQRHAYDIDTRGKAGIHKISGDI
jgi:hypothetical protein